MSPDLAGEAGCYRAEPPGFIHGEHQVTIEYLLKDSADPEEQIDFRLINALTVAEPWIDGEVEHLVYYIEALKALKSAGIRR